MKKTKGKLNFIPDVVIQAVRRYHVNRKTLVEKWDKKADIEFFEKIAQKFKSISYWQSSVGTFWITWKCGIQTVHNENAPHGIPVAKRIGKGKTAVWKEIDGVCFLTGKKA